MDKACPKCADLASRVDKLEADIKALATAGSLSSKAMLIVIQTMKDHGMGEAEVTH